MLFFCFLTIPALCSPEDVLATQRNNQCENYYLDVLVREKYSETVLRLIEEQEFDIGYQSEDDAVFESGKADFISVSYYRNRTVSAESIKN